MPTFPRDTPEARSLNPTCPSLYGGAGGAQVRINENDISFIPANVKAALFESVLEALGFLIRNDLMGFRLTDINHS